MRQWSKHLASGSHKAKWTEAEEKIQVKLSPELYQVIMHGRVTLQETGLEDSVFH